MKHAKFFVYKGVRMVHGGLFTFQDIVTTSCADHSYTGVNGEFVRGVPLIERPLHDLEDRIAVRALAQKAGGLPDVYSWPHPNAGQQTGHTVMNDEALRNFARAILGETE